MKTFSVLLPLCAGNPPVPLDAPHKGEWREDLMFSLVAWTNGQANNLDGGDLRRHRANFDITVM